MGAFGGDNIGGRGLVSFLFSENYFTNFKCLFFSQYLIKPRASQVAKTIDAVGFKHPGDSV